MNDVEAQEWLTTRQFATYWREHALDGRALWVVTNESRHSEPGAGYSLVGLFVSPIEALAYLAAEYLGSEVTARLVWQSPPDHDGYWQVYGYDDADNLEWHFLLIAERLNDRIADGRGLAALAECIALSPDVDPYAEGAEA